MYDPTFQEPVTQKENYADDMLDVFAELDVMGDDASPAAEPADTSPVADDLFMSTPPTPYENGETYADEQVTQKENYADDMLDLFAQLDVEETPVEVNIVGDDASPVTPVTDSSPIADDDFMNTPVTPYSDGETYADEPVSQKEDYADDMLAVFAELDVSEDAPDLASGAIAMGSIEEALGALDQVGDVPSVSDFWGTAPTASEFWHGDWAPHPPSGGPTGSALPNAAAVKFNQRQRAGAPSGAQARLAAARAQLAATQAALSQVYATGAPQQQLQQMAQDAQQAQPVQDTAASSDDSADTVSGEFDEAFAALDQIEDDDVVGGDDVALTVRGPRVSSLTSQAQAALLRSPAAHDLFEKRIASTRPLVVQRASHEGVRAWQIDFGPASAPAGQSLTLFNNPQCLFRGEKVIATDSAVPAGTGTRITRITVGQKVQRPNNGSTLTAFFAQTALASGITWDTTDPAYQVSITVTFLQSCTFDATVFGTAVL